MQDRRLDSDLVTNRHAITVCAMLCACMLATVRDPPEITANKMRPSQMLKRKRDEYEKFDSCSQLARAPDLL